MFKHPEEQCKEVKCSYKTCQKRHQKDCKWFLGESGCRHGNKCGFKHLIKKVVDEEYNLEEEIKSLKTAIMEKDESMKTLTNSIAVLDEQFNECKIKLEASKHAINQEKKGNENKTAAINSRDSIIQLKTKNETAMKAELDSVKNTLKFVKKELGRKESKTDENQLKIKGLEVNLVDKNKELEVQIRKNSVIQNLLNKKSEDLRKIEEARISISDVNEVENLKKNVLTCNICNFVGKSKSALQKHKKSKHVNKNPEDTENPAADEFANKVNDFLKSFNHLNNSEENFICDKCEANFASKEFLKIHIGATHKMKCQSCDFETGHNETMKEHIENPGIWHKNKLNFP